MLGKMMLVSIIVLAVGGMFVMAAMLPSEIADVTSSSSSGADTSGESGNITVILTGNPDGAVALFADSEIVANLGIGGARVLSLNATERCGLSVRIRDGLNEGSNAWKCVHHFSCLSEEETIVISIEGTHASVR